MNIFAYSISLHAQLYSLMSDRYQCLNEINSKCKIQLNESKTNTQKNSIRENGLQFIIFFFFRFAIKKMNYESTINKKIGVLCNFWTSNRVKKSNFEFVPMVWFDTKLLVYVRCIVSVTFELQKFVNFAVAYDLEAVSLARI